MIFLSAGHYPSAPGAKWERFVEHDEAIVWRDMLYQGLNTRAISVPTGVLRSKVDFINERTLDGDIAVEIHFNAARDANNNPIGRGCETLYYPGSKRGESIATTIQKVMAEFFPPDRGVKEGWYRMDPSRGADFFLAKTKCTAIIIEPEFVHRANVINDNREAVVNKLVELFEENFNE